MNNPGRRRFLQCSAVTALACISPTIYAIPGWLVPKFSTQLPTIPKIDGTRPQTLDLSVKQHRFTPGYTASTTEVFALGNMSYQGPIIEARRDKPTRLTVRNMINHHVLSEDVTTAVYGTTDSDRSNPRVSIHLHGGATPPASDGHPEDVFTSGNQKQYTYPNHQEAAMLWYHDHALGITRLNNWSGAQGLYILRDQYDTGDAKNTLGLPYGHYEIPLILQDRAYKNGTELRFMPATQSGSWAPGMYGDLSIVNGVAWPLKKVKRAVYRFRLLNGSNTRYYKLSLSNNMPFIVIGNDQGLLNQPASTTTLEIAPGERYDFLLDFRNRSHRERITLRNSERPPFGGGIIYGDYTDVMRFFVQRKSISKFTIPTRLRSNNNQNYPDRIHRKNPVHKRRFVLSQSNNLNLFSKFVINNLGYHDAESQMTQVPSGRWEQWDIVNTNLEAHVMHIHLVRFQLLERAKFNNKWYQLFNPKPATGRYWSPSADRFVTSREKPHAYEAGWKDTVICPSGYITRILVEVPSRAELGFNPDQVFANAFGKSLQGYMLHCHMLGHEDNDMMQGFRVT